MMEQRIIPESKAILKYMASRMRKKKGCNILNTGALGSGKSYQDLRLLEIWYELIFNEEFPITNVCSSLEEAILIVKDFTEIGEGVLIEEISVLAGSRDSLTRMNKLFNQFMDTCRIKQAVVIYNAPHINFVDKHILALTNVWMESLGVNFKEKKGIFKAVWLQTSQHKIEPYKHRFINDEGWEIDEFYLNIPSEKLRKAYDKLKDKSVTQLYDEIALKMRLEKQRQLKELGQKLLPPREKEAYDLRLKGLKIKEIAKKMGITFQAVGSYLKNAKKKASLNNMKVNL